MTEKRIHNDRDEGFAAEEGGFGLLENQVHCIKNTRRFPFSQAARDRRGSSVRECHDPRRIYYFCSRPIASHPYWSKGNPAPSWSFLRLKNTSACFRQT